MPIQNVHICNYDSGMRGSALLVDGPLHSIHINIQMVQQKGFWKSSFNPIHQKINDHIIIDVNDLRIVPRFIQRHRNFSLGSNINVQLNAHLSKCLLPSSAQLNPTPTYLSHFKSNYNGVKSKGSLLR